MMKKLPYICFVACSFLLVGNVFASTTTNDSRWDKGSSPIEILDRVAWESNAEYRIQETALDNVTDDQWAYATEYKIANTLDSIRIKIAPYLQWIFYIGLSAATLLIVYNGFLLVTWAVSGEDYKKVIGRIKNIAIGILVLTGFALIVRIFLAILSSVL